MRRFISRLLAPLLVAAVAVSWLPGVAQAQSPGSISLPEVLVNGETPPESVINGETVTRLVAGQRFKFRITASNINLPGSLGGFVVYRTLNNPSGTSAIALYERLPDGTTTRDYPLAAGARSIFALPRGADFIGLSQPGTYYFQICLHGNGASRANRIESTCSATRRIVAVEADGRPTAGAAPAAQTWSVNSPVNLTLPEATGGNISLDYALTPALPTGLSFNPETRTITGTPTLSSPRTTYTMTATDFDGDTAELMFEASIGLGTNALEVSVSGTPPAVSESSSSVHFTVIVSGAQTRNPLIIPFTVGGTAMRGSVASSVSIRAGEPESRLRRATITVPITEADADPSAMAASEGTETVIVTLGALPTVPGLSTFRANPGSATVQVLDTSSDIALGGMDREVNEHEAETVNIPIMVTGQRRRFTTFAEFSVTGSATPGTDYEVVTDTSSNPARTATCDADSCTGRIRLFGGQTSGEIQVRILSDGVQENARETIVVALTGHTSDGAETTPLTFDATPTRTIGVSDPAPPAVMVTPTTLAITENGAAGNYEVVLSAVPTEDVTVTTGITPAGHDLTLVPAVGNELTFTATDWNTAQTVTVSAGTDDDAINDTATISHTVTAIGNYAAITDAASVTVTVTDTNATDTTPTFGGTTQDDVTYIADAAITPLTLPMGVAGNGALIYELTPEVGTVAPGLTFGGAGFERVLRGTPTTAAGAVALTYTVADSDGNTNAADTTVLTFMVTVVAASRIDVAALDEVNEMILPEVARAGRATCRGGYNARASSRSIRWRWRGGKFQFWRSIQVVLDGGAPRPNPRR